MGDMFVLPDGMFNVEFSTSRQIQTYCTHHEVYRLVNALSVVSVMAKSLCGCDVPVCYFPLTVNNENSQLTETLRQRNVNFWIL